MGIHHRGAHAVRHRHLRPFNDGAPGCSPHHRPNPSHPGISDTTPPLSTPASPPPSVLKPSSALWNKPRRRPPRTRAAARQQDLAPPLVAPPEPNALHPHLLHVLAVARTRGWCWPGSILRTWRGGGWLTPRTASHQSNCTARPHSGILKKIHVGLACLTSCSTEPPVFRPQICEGCKSGCGILSAAHQM